MSRTFLIVSVGRSINTLEVNLDEFAVMPLAYLGWRSGYVAALPEWGALLAGFGLFRLFDIRQMRSVNYVNGRAWNVRAHEFAGGRRRLPSRDRLRAHTLLAGSKDPARAQ